ncbi:MAG TPA: GNAT family N-acetyltransferase [Nocardioidaceae bacterium]|nr:GNAT family N-acetyltransferase [Nocardioidaceae bacterium]
MRSLEEIWPPFALRVACGPIELRAIRDDDIPELVALVEGGIHHPDAMPFSFPWTTNPDVVRETARYYWRNRSEFGPDKWSLQLVVRHRDEIVGIQGIETEHYLVTRTGETGSWLGQPHQGHGIGTLMRKVLCAFVFDHLEATEITSGAFTDNPASLGVSRKVGYVENGRERLQRRPGEVAEVQRLVLTPDRLVRPTDPLQVTGVAGLRGLLGLD